MTLKNTTPIRHSVGGNETTPIQESLGLCHRVFDGYLDESPGDDESIEGVAIDDFDIDSGMNRIANIEYDDDPLEGSDSIPSRTGLHHDLFTLISG
jgi:hypothetical protein